MSKLYVTNLAQSASPSSVRQCFSVCGEVLDVDIVPERASYQSTSSAYVRMSTQAAADRAANRLHGTLLEGRSLVISHAPQDESRKGRRGAKAEEPRSSARITQQYRERASMTYELACHDVRLVVRIFFPEPEPSGWRVELSALEAEAKAHGTDASRDRALRAAADAWRALPVGVGAPELDWLAVEAALKAVRAV